VAADRCVAGMFHHTCLAQAAAKPASGELRAGGR
jgi:hypothetical protein